MRFLAHLFALGLLVLIILIVPVAFWVFNVTQVATNPQTYKRALETQNFYVSLVPAFVDAAAAHSTNAQEKAAFGSLIDNMTVSDWQEVSQTLLPAQWLETQIDTNIDRLFDWLGNTKPSPGISFDLKEWKAALENQKARPAVEIMIPRLPQCTKDEINAIQALGNSSDTSSLPLCDPQKKDLRSVMADRVSVALSYLSSQLPDRWALNDQLKKVDASATGGGLSEMNLLEFRASLWLWERLILLLFLVPVGLLSLIIVLTIRSGKQFFRWLGWALVISGVVTAITLLVLPTLGLAARFSPGNVEEIRQSGLLVSSLLGGMVNSIVASLSVGLMVQVAVVIVVGLLAVFLSILLPAAAAPVSKDEVQAEESMLRAKLATGTAAVTPVAAPAGSANRPPDMPR